MLYRNISVNTAMQHALTINPFEDRKARSREGLGVSLQLHERDLSLIFVSYGR
jgi:hypothetical protein